jgi:hypothetical protein
MSRYLVSLIAFVVLVFVAGMPCFSQTSAELLPYFKQVGLSQDQIDAITKHGQAVAINLKSRTPAEIYVFGAVYVNALAASYAKFASDYDRLRKVPEYLAIQEFSNPPKGSDLKGFELGEQDIKGLKDCKPGDCQIQLPGNLMEQIKSSVDWSAPNVVDVVNQEIQRVVPPRLTLYQQQGDKILGAVYNDKNQQVGVADQFKYLLSYSQVLPKSSTDFYNYLLSYPESKPPGVTNIFYWDNVKFGLKPTLRIIHVVTKQGANPTEPVYIVAEKQLYSSHYFETALDLTYCISAGGNPQQPGFYLIKLMGSEQAGLTGFKGSIVRKVAVGKSVSGLQSSLTAIKSALEKQ